MTEPFVENPNPGLPGLRQFLFVNNLSTTDDPTKVLKWEMGPLTRNNPVILLKPQKYVINVGRLRVRTLGRNPGCEFTLVVNNELKDMWRVTSTPDYKTDTQWAAMMFEKGLFRSAAPESELKILVKYLENHIGPRGFAVSIEAFRASQ